MADFWGRFARWLDSGAVPQGAEEGIDGLKEPELLTTRGMGKLAGEILHWKGFLKMCIPLVHGGYVHVRYRPKTDISSVLKQLPPPVSTENISLSAQQ